MLGLECIFVCIQLLTGSREHQRAGAVAQGTISTVLHSSSFSGATRLLPACVQKTP